MTIHTSSHQQIEDWSKRPAVPCSGQPRGRSCTCHEALELARAIGRHGRGHDLCLDAGMAREMKRLIAIRDDFDAITSQRGEMPFDEQGAALVVTQAADELYARSIWLDLLDEAFASGGILLPGRISGRIVQ